MLALAAHWSQYLIALLCWVHQADATPIGSCLEDGRGGMKRAMLELVHTSQPRPTDVIRYISCTLLHTINSEVHFSQQGVMLKEFRTFLDIQARTAVYTVASHAVQSLKKSCCDAGVMCPAVFTSTTCRQ